MNHKRKTLTVIVGPSGSGKTTLANLMVEKHGYGKVISCTTRSPRPGEVDGVDYYFLSREIFYKMIEDGDFVEHAAFGGAWYGISRAGIEAALTAGNGKAVSVNELVGYKNLEWCYNENPSDVSVTGIFLDAPTKVLAERLQKRDIPIRDLHTRLDLLQQEKENNTKYAMSASPNRRFLYNPTMKQLHAFLESYRPHRDVIFNPRDPFKIFNQSAIGTMEKK